MSKAQSHSRDAFRAARLLDPVSRGAFTGFVVIGILYTLFAVFVIVVEATTTPGTSRRAASMAILSALIVAGHLILESRSRSGMSWMRWSFFAFGILDLALTAWTTINDPTARVAFAGLAVVGGLWLFAARLMLVGRRRLRRAGLWVRILLFGFAWLGIGAFLAMFFI